MITWSSGVYTSQNATSASQTIWIEEQSGQNRVVRTEWYVNYISGSSVSTKLLNLLWSRSKHPWMCPEYTQKISYERDIKHINHWALISLYKDGCWCYMSNLSTASLLFFFSLTIHILICFKMYTCILLIKIYILNWFSGQGQVRK